MKCPKCDHKLTIEDVEANETWCEILSLVPVFGGEQKLVSEYVELFGLKPFTATAKKRLRLLKEVGALFAQKKFKFQQKIFMVSEEGIKEGLTVVCNKHFESPLENHNYLKKVLMAISKREQKEGRDKEARRLESEEAKRLGSREAGKPAYKEAFKPPSLPASEPERSEECLSREEVARLAGEALKHMEGR